MGIAGTAGGAAGQSGAKLMILTCFGRSGAIRGFDEAIVYGADMGAAISSNSWGYTRTDVYDEAELSAIDYFNANGGGEVSDGGVVVFAAGNDDDGGKWYPAYYGGGSEHGGSDRWGDGSEYGGAVAVAATDNRLQRAGFSNYGPWVDIAAPGVSILSTVLNGGYSRLSGTSMACPMVSGIIALFMSHAPRLTRRKYLECLYTTARPTGWTSKTIGGGVADPGKALEGCLLTVPFAPPSPPAPPSLPPSPSPPPHPPSPPPPPYSPPSAPSVQLTVSILTDNFPGETTWTLSHDATEVARGGPFQLAAARYEEQVMLSPGEYTFTIQDSASDGLCCGFGRGGWRLDLAGRTFFEGDPSFESSATKVFEVLGEAQRPRPPPPMASPPPMTGDAYDLLLKISTDDFPQETTWEVLTGAGVVVTRGGPYNQPGHLFLMPLRLIEGYYTFAMRDANGDGMCCFSGRGFYKLLLEPMNTSAPGLVNFTGTTIAEGSSFASMVLHPFTLPFTAPPSPPSPPPLPSPRPVPPPPRNNLLPFPAPPPPSNPGTRVTVSIITDDYPSETSWDLVFPAVGLPIGFGGPYTLAKHRYDTDLSLPDGTYILNVYDSYGDGLCCQYGRGGFKVFVTGLLAVEVDDFESGNMASRTFTIPYDPNITIPSPSPSPSPPPSPSPSPVVSPVPPPVPPPTSPQTVLAVIIRTDRNPFETTWNLRCGFDTIVSGGPYNEPETTYSIPIFITRPCTYVFTILDLFGDGLCCGHGQGSYQIVSPNGYGYPLVTGVEFNTSARHEIVYPFRTQFPPAAPPPPGPPPAPPPLPPLTVSIMTDNYPAEITWHIRDAAGVTVAHSEPYIENSRLYDEIVSLSKGEYTFVITDRASDGICCGFGSGFYALSYRGIEFARGGAYTNMDTVDFSLPLGSATPPSPPGSPALPTPPSPPPMAPSSPVVITIVTDRYPSETTWSVTDGRLPPFGMAYGSGGPYEDKETEHTYTLELPAGTYLFVIQDAADDGLCCSYGRGRYSVEANGVTVAAGAEFGASEPTRFTVEEQQASPPSPAGGCAGWCAGSPASVDKKCNTFAACMGCGFCQRQAPPSLPPRGRCAGWCATSTNPQKCTFAGCSGCRFCQ